MLMSESTWTRARGPDGRAAGPATPSTRRPPTRQTASVLLPYLPHRDPMSSGDGPGRLPPGEGGGDGAGQRRGEG